MALSKPRFASPEYVALVRKLLKNDPTDPIAKMAAYELNTQLGIDVWSEEGQ